MFISVIGGVIIAMALTLPVAPVVYVWLDRFAPRGGEGSERHRG